MQYRLYTMSRDGLSPIGVPLRKLFWRGGPSYGRTTGSTGTIVDHTDYPFYLTAGDVFEARP